MMQRASHGLALTCASLLRERRGGLYGSRVVLLVGSGNNGGDTLFAGAMLAARGCAVEAVTVSQTPHPAGLAALIDNGGRVTAVTDEAAVADVVHRLRDADLVMDGVVGIGGKGPLRPTAAILARAAANGDAIRVAVDIPSGVDPDTGQVEDVERVFSADVTVTFGCWKTGLLGSPGRDSAGAVEVVDIGLEPYLNPAPDVRAIQISDLRPYLRVPRANDHKYSRGVVGVLAGSRRYPGAALLTVGGARRSGVGMVRILDRDDGVAQQVIDHYPDVVAHTEEPAADPRVLAWAVGPGIGAGRSDQKWLIQVMEADVPVVLDADAITLVAKHADVRRFLDARAARGSMTVLTPHVGEFGRLGFHVGSGGRVEAAKLAARELGCLVLLKGSGSVVAAPTGAVYIDPLGAHDLATAGSGDVLTGLIAGVLAHRSATASITDSARAVAAAAYIHGMAGIEAGADGVPVTSSDIVAALPGAVAGLRS